MPDGLGGSGDQASRPALSGRPLEALGQGEEPKAPGDAEGHGLVWLGESSTRCHLTNEHRMQFVTHVSRTRIGIVTNSVSLCVNEDVIGEKRYIKVVVVC